jgi:crotonobetainyl-CoA:carnitine CoA-transferase CaiB-like acyl-CoA transferase
VTTSSASLPLAGLRILAPTQLGAGPFGLMFLADLGRGGREDREPATRGDEARTVPPFNDPAAHDGLYFQALNPRRPAASRSISSDPEGRAVLHRLVPRFDAVFNNLRGDQTAALGLDYATLAPCNPRVVCCSLSGFGRTGPRRDEPAYDYLLQAYAGFMSITGEPDAPPTKSGISVVDFSGGILAALALMIGLHRAQRTGVGADVDVSLLDTALSMLNYMAAWSLDRGWVPARHPDGAHQSLVPNQTFRPPTGGSSSWR